MKLSQSQLRKLISEAINDQNVIRIGETYQDPTGNSITVTDIYVYLSSASGEPATWVEYDFETVDGRSGSEKNHIDAVTRILKGKQ